jgi:hypothetical protein
MYNGRISSEIIGEKITQNQILRAIIGLSCGTNGSEN